LESFPYRVVTSSRRPRLRGWVRLPRGSFFAPSTTSPGQAPCCSGPSGPAAVPLPGFLNLSAVSWQVRASRPCFMPLPPVGFSLQSVAPRWDRVRLSASLAPLQFSTVVPEVRCARSRPPGFTDARARDAVAWLPTGARPPFLAIDPSRRDARGSRLRTLSRAGLRGLLDDLDLTHRTHLVPAASSASKLCSPRESVRTAPRFRRHTAAGALLGFAPPEP